MRYKISLSLYNHDFGTMKEIMKRLKLLYDSSLILSDNKEYQEILKRRSPSGPDCRHVNVIQTPSFDMRRPQIKYVITDTITAKDGKREHVFPCTFSLEEISAVIYTIKDSKL